VELDTTKSNLAVFLNDIIPVQIPEKNTPLHNGMEITVSLFDRQFLLAFDNQQVLTIPLKEDVEAPPRLSSRFALGVQGMEVVVENLRIFRDVYYSEPIGRILMLGGRSRRLWGTIPTLSWVTTARFPRIAELGATFSVLFNSLQGKP